MEKETLGKKRQKSILKKDGQVCEFVCPVSKCMNVIGGKWKIILLHLISQGTNRFGKLQKTLPNISKQMLTSQLRELENDGILERKIYPEIPPKVEYIITIKGETLSNVIKEMEKWGKTN